MDREIIYSYSKGVSESVNNLQQDAMIGLGDLYQAIFGTSTVVSGLGCNPTAPASLSVQIQPGIITQYTQVDASAPGSGSTNTNNVVKAGSLHAPVNIALTAPSTTGQSINYLIEAQFTESDVNAIDLDYINPTNGVSYTGNSAVYTQRIQYASLQVKAGAAASTGTQTTPGADAGWTGLWVVTVNAGQTQITSGDIAEAPNVPWALGNFVSPADLSAYLTTAAAASEYVATSSLSTGSTGSSVAQRDSSGGLTATAFHGLADNATNAVYATSAGSASTATTAANATYANSAGTASTATTATTASTATTAGYASSAGNAATANSATTLQGYSPSTSASASSIAQRDAGGNLTATTFNGVATSADFADLAERYEASEPVHPGDVVEFGGDKEIQKARTGYFGVVSSDPGYLLNAKAGHDISHPPIALDGRVPVKVVGAVKKFDYLVMDGKIPGVASASSTKPTDKPVIGRALTDKTDTGIGLVEASVKRGH